MLIEDFFLHKDLFGGIDQFDLAGRSLSRAVEEKFFMRPTAGKQRFRAILPNSKQARQLQVPADTPILFVQRYLHFPQADNAVYAVLTCRTDRFDFSQNLGGVTYEVPGIP